MDPGYIWDHKYFAWWPQRFTYFFFFFWIDITKYRSWTELHEQSNHFKVFSNMTSVVSTNLILVQESGKRRYIEMAWPLWSGCYLREQPLLFDKQGRETTYVMFRFRRLRNCVWWNNPLLVKAPCLSIEQTNHRTRKSVHSL